MLRILQLEINNVRETKNIPPNAHATPYTLGAILHKFLSPISFRYKLITEHDP